MPPNPRSAPFATPTHLGSDRPVLVRGEGCHVWDREGRRYLDATSGAFCVTLGYTRPDLIEAMTRAAERLPHARPSRFDSEEAEAYRAELLEAVGEPFSRVLLTSSGSEAVDAAIKVAIAYQCALGREKRTAIRSLRGHYHGATLGALAVTGWAERRAPWEMALGPRLEGLPLAGGSEEDGRESAAFLAETIPTAALGVEMPRPGALAERRARCDAAGVLWIADEVLTGFGRVGSLFAWRRLAEERAEDAGAVPDLVTFGKGAGAGFAPIAGVLVAARVAKALESAPGRGDGALVEHQQSYGGNPIAAAVGRAVLRALATGGELDRARGLEGALRAALAPSAARMNSTINGLGMLAGFGVAGGARGGAAGIVRAAAARGLLLHAAGPSRLVVAPPLVMTAADWSELGETLDAAVRGEG
ncbi:MAG: aspartate aminotransferase family protein [Candidatus Eisenbacteria bacterium]